MQPPVYVIIADFSADEANAVAGRSTVLTTLLDQEFGNIKLTLDAILTNLSVIQRDDTEINDGLVKLHTLSTEVLALLGSAGFTVHDPLEWATLTDYEVGEMVVEGTGTYVCAVAHTSGTFATDLAAFKWAKLFDTASYDAAAITNTPAGDIASATVQAALNELDTEKLKIALLTGKGALITATAANTPATLAAGSDFKHLRARAGATGGLEYSSVGGSRVLGFRAQNNTGTPNTQFNMSATEVHLLDSNGSSVVRLNTGVVTCNVSTAGPAANGRDQAAALSAGYAHFYFIWNEATSTLATIVSATAPPTGPTLPSGYTHWAYAGSVYWNGSALAHVMITGSRAFYKDITGAGILSSSTGNTTEQTLSLGTPVPSIALHVYLQVRGAALAGGGGAVNTSFIVRHTSTFNFAVFQIDLVASTAGSFGGQIEVPNLSGSIYWLYANVTNVSSQSVTIEVMGYTVPNGGE